ncbi:DUF4157 domain-containing protein [Massilia sp. CF038]|uniref:eCIS core domain-containing protein n=1 Tax=Massilia sp. CF038 TaxID=1881045 RepID=UPI0009225ACA|nr:DUF4157 domain-containing protein [Massilia sp. CF038]SHH71312.1 protein of unknown function [Massilia sp. CF038]
MHTFAEKPQSAKGKAGAAHSPQQHAAPARLRPAPAAPGWHDFARLPVHPIAPALSRRPSHDAAEREADQAAAHVLRMADPGQTDGVLQRQPGAGRDSAAAAAPPLVHQALRHTHHPLDQASRQFFEARFGHDFGHVRVHTSALAARSAQAMGAAAYTVGRDVVFGAGRYAPHTASGKQLLAHELSHVIQQGQGALRIDMQDAGAPASITEQVVAALNRPDPVAGVGDYDAAYRLLNGLSMQDMLRVLNDLAAQSMLEVLISRPPQAGVDVARISAAITLVRLAHTDAAGISQSELDAFGGQAQSLPSDQQQAMLDFATVARHISDATREGLAAMMAGAMAMAAAGASAGGLSPAVAGGISGPVAPGPWAPPGRQPIPYYIGNQAHIGIAANYVGAHPGDPVFTNFIPLSSILSQASALGIAANPGALSAASLALKPDILNLAPSRRHLYEIKPTTLQSAGRAEARMYAGLMATAGVPVTLGPIGEPGTFGAVPAPGGIYLFEAIEPGVITYQYRRQQLVPVPVPEGEPVRERRFQLAPLTPQQQAVMVATTMTVGMMCLIIMMILLSPVGI